MSNPENSSEEASSSNPKTPDKAELERAFRKTIMAAIEKGLAEFFRFDPFKYEDRRERGLFALSQATKVLPDLIGCFVIATLERDHWKMIPTFSGKKKQKEKIAKQVFEKIVDRELDELTKGSGWDPEPTSVEAALKRLSDIKRIKPLIGGELSDDERDAISRRQSEDATIEAIVLREAWMEVLPTLVMHAVIRDKLFFERLGRALYDGVKPSISQAEVILTVNWEKPCRGLPLNAPGLKFWRDEAVREFLSAMCYPEKDGGLDLSAYRSIRDRIGLKRDKPILIEKCEAIKDAKSGKLRLVLTGC